MSIFSKIYEIGKTIHDTIKEINILDEIYKQDERIYKGSLLNQIDEMENSANEAENIIHKEINLEKNSQKLKQKQGLFRAKKIRGIVCQTPQAGNRHSVKTGGEYRCNRNRKSTPLFDV